MYGWTFEKKKFEIPLCKGEQCLPLRGKHDKMVVEGSEGLDIAQPQKPQHGMLSGRAAAQVY